MTPLNYIRWNQIGRILYIIGK